VPWPCTRLKSVRPSFPPSLPPHLEMGAVAGAINHAPVLQEVHRPDVVRVGASTPVVEKFRVESGGGEVFVHLGGREGGREGGPYDASPCAFFPLLA